MRKGNTAPKAPAVPRPVQVTLPAGVRERLVREAESRGLPLSQTLGALVAERIAELDDETQLTDAETWQRQEAWASWERLKRGEYEPVPAEAIDGVFAQARGKRSR